MPAYIIVQSDDRRALMTEYRKHTRPAWSPSSAASSSCVGGKTNTLEGGWTPPRMVVLEFPDMAAAERFYDLPEYKPVLDMRPARRQIAGDHRRRSQRLMAATVGAGRLSLRSARFTTR